MTGVWRLVIGDWDDMGCSDIALWLEYVRVLLIIGKRDAGDKLEISDWWLRGEASNVETKDAGYWDVEKSAIGD